MTAREELHDLARRIEVHAAWNDLVLPPAELGMLQGIVAMARPHPEGGSALPRKDAKELGNTALFSGGSNSAKTKAAEVLAAELHLELYRVDLARVASKYIGETEKNLARLFDAAEETGAILFFDEADALFGRRSAVRDSHDRYANIEIDYLLRRIGSHRGLVILATTMKQALDPGFVRRLRFVVNFP